MIVDRYRVDYMGKMKRLCIVAALLVCSAACFAKQISFQIVQHDDSAKAVTEQSLTIEDEVLNSFFDYGFIVTNSDAKVAVSESQDEKFYKNGVGEAFNGYSDYFIQISLFYERTDETVTADADLKKVKFVVTSVQTGEKVAVKSVDNIKLEHKKDDLKKVSASLVTEINKALKSNKA